MLIVRRMVTFRWLGAVVLLGSVGCSSSSAPGAPDGSAGGGDGSTQGDAGSPADAVAAGETGTADAGCVTGLVTFEVQTAPGSPTRYCLGAPDSCSANWLTIRPASAPADGGAALNLGSGCETQCGNCQPVACANLCAVPTALGDGGAQQTWDGTYSASGTCGAGMACISPACAPPGNYVATFCGYAASPDASAFECAGSSAPTCMDKPFAWPPAAGSAPVQGFLGGDSTGDAG
jgi:hypothetical protein